MKPRPTPEKETRGNAKAKGYCMEGWDSNKTLRGFSGLGGGRRRREEHSV